MTVTSGELLITLNIDRREFRAKPTPKETEGIQVRSSKPQTVAFSELVRLIEKGCTFRQAAINGRSEDGWISQRIFVLDFDNDDAARGKVTIQTAINMALAAQIPPAIVYRTFHDTEDAEFPRFRMIFLMDKVITNIGVAKAIQQTIIRVFDGLIDERCQSLNWLFYGTNKNCEFATEVFCDSGELSKGFSQENQASGQNRTRKSRSHRAGATPQRTDIIQAIERHDADYIRDSLHCEPQVFDTPQEFFDFVFCEIDISEVLGLPTRKAFSCILPSHRSADKTPSASIFQAGSGVWLYHCFAECMTLNVKQLFEVLGAFRSEWQVIEFIKKSFNLTVTETQWSIEQKSNLDNIILTFSLANEKGFSSLCPCAAVNTRYGREIFMSLLTIARNTIYPERVADGDIIFYASLKSIATGAGKATNNLKRIGQHVKALCYHDMLEILPDNQVPKKMLRSALKNSRNQDNHVQFFRVKSWVFQQLQTIESQGKRWQEQGYTVKGISREMFYRAEGEEVANRLYPQTSHYTDRQGKVRSKRTSKASDQRHAEVAAIILEYIESQGFCTKQMVIEQLSGNIPQYERSIADICDTYSLRRVRANKALKAKYNIPGNGYPIIIILDEELQ